MDRVITKNGEKAKEYKVIEWIGIILNAVFPLAEGISFAL